MKGLCKCLAQGVAVLTIGCGANVTAGVIVSESFDYTGTTTINGQGGVSDGWGGAWTVTADGDNFHSFTAASSLSYPSGVNLTSSGGHITNMSNESAVRALATPIAMDPGTARELWVSMLVNKSDTGKIEFGFEREDGTRRVKWGFDTDEKFGVNIDGEDTFFYKTTDAYSVDTDLLVVVKLSLVQGPAKDSIALKVFEPGDEVIMPTAPGDFDVTYSGGTGILASKFFIQGTSQFQKVDEILIGDTFADVAPVPEPGALTFGAMGLLLICRRR